MLDSHARAHIERELDQVDRLLQDYADLLAISQGDEPSLVERTALSAVVQSFYQGIEGVFQTIAKRIDNTMPSGADWHRRLLEQMVADSGQRPPAISSDTLDRLEPFLGFRHLARHTYPFLLVWDRMSYLVPDMTSLYAQIRREVAVLLESLDHGTEQTD